MTGKKASSSESSTSPATERVQEPHIHIAPSEDRTHASLEVTSGRKKIVIDVTAEQVADLIVALGAVHQAMLGNAVPPIEGAKFAPVRRTQWALQLDSETQGSILAFQHPAYGPIGLALTPGDSAKLAQGLTLHQQLSAVTMNASGRAN